MTNDLVFEVFLAGVDAMCYEETTCDALEAEEYWRCWTLEPTV
jgi:hypothetical protein